MPSTRTTAPSADGTLVRPRASTMREAFGSLTTRGRGFVAGGIAAAVCGIVLGERDLVRIGVLITLLPIVAAFWIARSGNRLGLVRTLAGTRIGVGQSVAVRLEITNVGPTTGLLLVEEQVPWVLGSRPRFVIDALKPRHNRTIDYTVRAEQRGRYQVGPLRIRVSDPAGMVELHRVFQRTADLIVVPATEHLPSRPLRGAWTGSGDNRPRPYAAGSAADVSVREYRQGDEVRRVHWPSTARTGILMVRSEEQPWQSRCTLLVDNRESAHRGHGPGSSLERAISVTASIAVHLAANGYQVRLVSAQGDEDDVAWHDESIVTAEPILDRLAVLPASPVANLQSGWVDDTVTAGMIIAVLGSVDDHDRRLLARLHQRDNAAYAIVLDVDTWVRNAATNGAGQATRQATSPATRPATGSSAHAPWLHQHGWKAATLDRAGSLPAAWQELGR